MRKSLSSHRVPLLLFVIKWQACKYDFSDGEKYSRNTIAEIFARIVFTPCSLEQLAPYCGAYRFRQIVPQVFFCHLAGSHSGLLDFVIRAIRPLSWTHALITPVLLVSEQQEESGILGVEYWDPICPERRRRRVKLGLCASSSTTD